MKNKLLKWLIIPGAIGLMWHCEQSYEDSMLMQRDQIDTFFETKTVDPFKDFVVGYLKNLNDSLEFVTDFSSSLGYPQWDKSISNYNENTGISTLMVPVIDQKQLTAIYYFKEQDDWLNYFLVLNDEDDINYQHSKYLIQYFEKTLNLTISNQDFEIEVEPTSQLKSNYIVYEVCYTWWQHDEWSGWREMTECSYSYTPIGGGGGGGSYSGGAPSVDYTPGGGGSGGGTGSGSDLPKDMTAKEKLNLIVDYSLVPQSVQVELKDALEKSIDLMNKNCVGELILDQLVIAGATIKLNYDPAFGYSGGYNAISNQFIFSTIDSWYGTQFLIHEFTHALQDALYPPEVIESASSGLKIGKIQIELEAHTIEVLGRSGRGTERYKRLSHDRNIQRNYELQILEKLKAGESINMENFNALLGPFGEYYAPEYNTPPNLNFAPTLFKQALSNCND